MNVTFLPDKGPSLETLDHKPTSLYFDLYFNTAYAAHNIYCLFYTFSNTPLL